MRLPQALFLGLWPWTPEPTPSTPNTLNFTLRHIHGHKGRQVVFKDVLERHRFSIAQHTPQYETSFALTPVRTKTYKPRSQAEFFQAREASLRRQRRKRRGELVEDEEVVVAWDEWDVPGPNTGDRETLKVLAKMTWNAYMTPDDGQWYDLGEDWGTSYPFGWEPDADGFRGHVFVASDNSTVVVSIKGTSAGVLGGGGPTVIKDKLNDNLMFRQVTGHSLGGSLSGLLGITFGAPVVTFEAPGDKMPARRLHLPKPPEVQHVTHIFHTADPIPMGTCTGVLSSCAIAGFAMESRCHVGKKRVYDTVTRYGWSQDVRTHRIGVIIDRLLAEDWEEGKPVPDETTDGPECDQQECYYWSYDQPQNASSFD
ncbi:putative lipase atg15 [Serendipita sp. 399]|nr:putative lipase atg15 [Serendipita sp. 399]